MFLLEEMHGPEVGAHSAAVAESREKRRRGKKRKKKTKGYCETKKKKGY